MTEFETGQKPADVDTIALEITSGMAKGKGRQEIIDEIKKNNTLSEEEVLKAIVKAANIVSTEGLKHERGYPILKPDTIFIFTRMIIENTSGNIPGEPAKLVKLGMDREFKEIPPEILLTRRRRLQENKKTFSR